MFKPILPSSTAGNGLPRPSSLRTGRGQGRGTSKLISKCQICGFPNDVKKTDTSGGDESGDGARGVISKTNTTGTLLNGVTFTEKYGDAATNKGSGCAFCHSKNAIRFNKARLPANY